MPAATYFRGNGRHFQGNFNPGTLHVPRLSANVPTGTFPTPARGQQGKPAGALGSPTPWPLLPTVPKALMRAGSLAVPLPVERGLEKPQPSHPAKAGSPLRWFELVTKGPRLLSSEK